MASKRIPSGITWQQHQHFGTALKNLWTFLQPSNVDRKRRALCNRLSALLLELRSELDELVFIDCPDKSKNSRLDTYFGWRDVPDISSYGFAEARTALLDLRVALLPKNPDGKAMKHVDAMLARMDKAGV